MPQPDGRRLPVAMDAELSPAEATRAKAHLQAMADAIDGVAGAGDADRRRQFWYTYEENQVQLHALLPRVGDPTADEGPYTSET